MSSPIEPPVQGSLHSIEISDIAFPNDYGVGKIDGYVLFVPGALPGDRITTVVTETRKRFGYGKIVAIDSPSPYRKEPQCPHFGLCGGCTLQNLDYNHQLVVKEHYLHETLKRVGNMDITTIAMLPVVPSPEIFFYRGKLELAFGQNKGVITLGLRRRVSPGEDYEAGVIPIALCPVFSTVIEKIIPLVTDFAMASHLKPFNPGTNQGFLRHLVIRESKSTGQIMLILETTTGTLPDLIPPWKTLNREIPQISSLYSVTNNGPGDVVRYHNPSLIAGESFIEEISGPFRFRIHPGSFYQPNPTAARGLCEAISGLGMLQREDTLMGLYCGTGPFEISLSPAVKRVIGVDSLPENIADAIENCRINKRHNCSFYTMTVESLSRVRPSHKADVVILDPPRGGMSAVALKTIFNIAPSRIIYVSCSPSTLARDLKLFHERGYTARTVVPFDFFPHTSHLETLVCLVRQ